MCTALFYYTCVYIYSLLNSCGYWTLNKYYYYYYYYYYSVLFEIIMQIKIEWLIILKNGNGAEPEENI